MLVCVCLCACCRFESRWLQVNIAADSPSIWLKGMGDSTIGVWAAHGEGQVLFPDAAVQAAVLDSKLAPIRWVIGVVNAIFSFGADFWAWAWVWLQTNGAVQS